MPSFSLSSGEYMKNKDEQQTQHLFLFKAGKKAKKKKKEKKTREEENEEHKAEIENLLFLLSG